MDIVPFLFITKNKASLRRCFSYSPLCSYNSRIEINLYLLLVVQKSNTIFVLRLIKL